MKATLKKWKKQLQVWTHHLGGTENYNYATVIDYAEGRHEPQPQYRTLDQVLTVTEHVLTGRLGETVLLVCYSGGGSDGSKEFGNVLVIWNGGYESFRWVEGTQEFKDAYLEAVYFIKNGKKE
jgi:hypothetical protein